MIDRRRGRKPPSQEFVCRVPRRRALLLCTKHGSIECGHPTSIASKQPEHPQHFYVVSLGG